MSSGTPGDLRQVDVAGVPAFWVPAPGRWSVALLFGVGVRDESLVVRGIDHLVEHLTVFGLDHRALEFNAHVSATATAFTVTGGADEVQAVLDHVGTALDHLDDGRLDLERRVLRTEARSRPRTLNGLHLDHRFGPNGLGLLEAEELGLRWLGAGDLRSWIGTWFTAGNAALAVVGPDPRGLRLHLPPGPRPTRAPAPPELIDHPTWSAVPGSVVAISTTAPRSARWTVATALLTQVAEHRLRQVEGRSYSVVELSLPVDAARTHTYVGADCLAEEADRVQEALSAELTRLRTRGPAADEVDAAVASLRRTMADDRAAMGAAYAAADALLLGREVPPPGQVLAEVAAVGPDDVASALDASHRQILWTVPFTSPISDRRYAHLPPWSTHRVEGTEYRPGAGREPDHHDDRLLVGPDGVTLVHGEDPVTVRWTDLRAAGRFTDRSWVLHGTDGFILAVRARDWFRGGEATADIALLAPRHLVIDMGEELSPGDPDVDPERPVQSGTTGSTAGGRWRASVAGRGTRAPTAPSPAPRPGRPTPGHGSSEHSVLGAVAIVWVFAAVVAAWVLTTVGDGSGNRAKLKVIGLVVVGAAYATRTLLRR